MAKIKARGAKEIARFLKAGGETIVLTLDEKGRTKCLKKWTKGARYAAMQIPVAKTPDGGRSIYTDQPTSEQFEAWALSQGYERAGVRR